MKKPSFAYLLLALPLAASADDGQPFALTVVVAGKEMPVRALQAHESGDNRPETVG